MIFLTEMKNTEFLTAWRKIRLGWARVMPLAIFNRVCEQGTVNASIGDVWEETGIVMHRDVSEGVTATGDVLEMENADYHLCNRPRGHY